MRLKAECNIMMNLTTVSKKVSEKSVLVYWRVGTKRKGIVDVRMGFSTGDQEIIAELIAIRHLIMSKQVFCCTPTTGKGFKVTVSKGAIRKIVQGRSNKPFASRFASLLTGRMAGVLVEVSHSMNFMLNEQDPYYTEAVEVLEAAVKDFASPREVIDTPRIGQLSVTKHAVKRYEERLNSKAPEEKLYRPWVSLFARLRNPDLECSPLNDSVLRHKMRRYGRDNKVEIWSHPSDTMRFTVVVRPDGTKVLVTVFDRGSEYL